jgi:hypothetical protein
MRWDFATRPPSFVRRPEAGKTPAVKGLARRAGEVGGLAESLPPLPTPGEALHLLMTSYGWRRAEGPRRRFLPGLREPVFPL